MIGLYNPLAPPVLLRGRRPRGHAAPPRSASAYEGPPGCVHGGVIAALFDELLGVANITSGVGAMTGTLTIKYRSPTPLHTPLDFAARTTSIDGRKVFTTRHDPRRRPAVRRGRRHLHPGRAVALRRSTRASTAARRPRPTAAGDVSTRRVALGGPVNFRDLGGYPAAGGRTVRWGQRVPQRLAAPARHRRRPAPRRDLGIVTAIDFRANDELDRIGIGPLGELDVRHVHLATIDRAMHGREMPDISQTRTAAEIYFTMLETGAPSYAEALRELAEPGALPGGLLLHGRQGPHGRLRRAAARPARGARRRTSSPTTR